MKFEIGKVYLNTGNNLFYKLVDIRGEDVYFKYGTKFNDLQSDSVWEIESLKPPLFIAFTKAQEYLYG